ncbi:MAG: PDZ domain-containing protein [Fidelibacterota bacterium]
MKKTTQTYQSTLLMVIYGLILLTLFLVTKVNGMETDDKKKKNFKDEYREDIEESVGEIENWNAFGFKYFYPHDLGLSYDDIDFQDINEKDYSYTYGVKIRRIYRRSAAYDAGLKAGDILMTFAGDTVFSEEQLDQLIEELGKKDKLSVTYFRDGKEFKTILYLDGEYDDDYEFDDDNHDIDFGFHKKRKKKNVGIFGMYWSPSFILNEYEAANNLLTDLSFQDNEIQQLWFNEFGFKFYVGKNTFLGMVFAGADAEGSTTLQLNAESPTIHRKMKFEQGMWGFTLDKRYRVLDRMMVSSGVFIGRGKSILTLHQQNGEIIWNELWSEDKHANNDYLKMKKRELVFEPRISAMYRMLGPIWLKVEAGYMLGYSNKHWRDITTDDEYQISNAPETSLFDGVTFTISPWIGF